MWAAFLAGFSPIPNKVFTLAAGALSMALLPFTIALILLNADLHDLKTPTGAMATAGLLIFGLDCTILGAVRRRNFFQFYAHIAAFWRDPWSVFDSRGGRHRVDSRDRATDFAGASLDHSYCQRGKP